MLRKSYQVFSSQFYDLMNLNVSLQKPKNLHKNLYHINPILSTKKKHFKLRHLKNFLSCYVPILVLNSCQSVNIHLLYYAIIYFLWSGNKNKKNKKWNFRRWIARTKTSLIGCYVFKHSTWTHCFHSYKAHTYTHTYILMHKGGFNQNLILISYVILNGA